MERTLSIIKPDATTRNITGKVNAMIEEAGLRIVAQKRVWLSKNKAFFAGLVEFMTSAPVIVQVLEADNAIELYRKTMGATNPAVADEGTIRKTFALSIDKNTVHGSDSPEAAAREIAYFFSRIEIIG